MDAERAAAPPVVAVIVTSDPGAWFEDVLEAFAAQDYPNLSVLVVDAASEDDPTPRVGRVLPDAYVRRLDVDRGYGASTNEVLEVVDGAAFFCLCHDDVVPDPGTVRNLVEEAIRSNAGVVGPKQVAWDDPGRLLAVGMTADKTGVPRNYVEPDERDQEQHDAVRDVLYLPGGLVLVRADLFEALGGFDPAIDFLGDDLDLGWRAHLAGARVIVAPQARIRHLEALGERREVDDRRALFARHRLRTVLTCYSLLGLVRVLPQAALFAAVEIVYSVLAGRLPQARDVAGAWTWNFRRLGEIRRARKRIKDLRRVPDREIRRLQAPGSARLSLFLRGQIGLGEDRLRTLVASGRSAATSLRDAKRRTAIGVWVGASFVLAFGSRHLLTRGVAAVGDLAPLPPAVGDLFARYLSGWNFVGVGSDAPVATGVGLLGLGGLATLGNLGLLRTLLLVGALPLGLLGADRLARPLGSRRGRLVAVATYLALPLPYNALATGHAAALTWYALAPWILLALARAAGAPPYGAGAEGDRPAPWWPSTVRLGVLTALAAAVVPFSLVLVVGLGAALAAGALLGAGPKGLLRAPGAALAAAGVAVVLHLPWSLDHLVPGGTWAAFAAVDHAGDGALAWLDLLHFRTGPIGAEWAAWGLLAVAAFPLAVAAGPRLAWAHRAWTIAAVGWLAALLGERGWLEVGLPPADLFLALAGISLALAAACGMAAFEQDLPGFRFGWRQALAIVAGLGLLAGLLPVLGASFDGRWRQPGRGLDRTLSFMAEQDDGGFRVLWLGDPRVLPVGAWELTDGVGYGLSRQGPASVTERWPTASPGAAGLVADAVSLAGRGDTVRLGRMLGAFGIRYVVVPSRAGPDASGLAVHPAPPALIEMLGDQLDLRELEIDPSIVLYENAAWIPSPGLPPGGPALPEGTGLRAVAALPPGGGAVALPALDRSAGATGAVGAGAVLLAEGASSRWRLQVDGRSVPRSKAFGWGNAFEVAAPGQASLSFRTPLVRPLFVGLQVILWLVALRIAGRRRGADG